MKLNKLRTIALISVLVLAVGTYSFANASTVTDKGKEIGQQQANIYKSYNDSKEIAVSINGYNVNKEDFEEYKFIMNQNENYSDKELLDKIIREKAVYIEAMNQGFEVSDSEISTAIEEVKKLLRENENKDQYNYLKNYIDGLGITEDQYWSEKVTPIYRETFTANKLIDNLRLKYSKVNQITDSAGSDSKFNDYLENYRNDLVSKANIEIYIDLN